jgi:hypothetical protein
MFFKGFICHIIYMSNLFIPKVCILFSRNYFPRRGSFFIFTLLIEAIIISNCRKMQKWVTIKYCKVFFPLIFLGLISNIAIAQPKKNPWKPLKTNSVIKIFYKKFDCKADNEITDGRFRIKINDSDKALNKDKWFTIIIRYYENCESATIKVDKFIDKVGDLSKDGEYYAGKGWEILGGNIIDGQITLSDQNPKETKPKIIPKPKELPVCTVIVPSRINSNSDEPVEVGQSVFLSLSDDARLCDGYNWVWYKDSCDGVPLQQDRSGRLIQTPNRTTTYYVRAEKGNIKTECRAVRVEVVKPTVSVPIKITRSKNEQICPGEFIELIVSGGRENEVKDWVWYKDKINSESTPYQKGTDRITVKATERNTIYWVGDLKDKRVIYHKIDVQAINVPQLQAITLSNNNAPLITNNQEAKITVCEGEKISLKITNENVKDFKFNWYTDTNKSNIPSGIMLEKTPSDNITYYVRAEGVCNYRTKFIKIDVNVIKKILPPTFSVSNGTGRNRIIKITENSVNQLPVTWNWYLGSDCQGKSFTSGNLITHNLKDGLKLSVRANRDLCGSSECFNYTIPESDNKSNRFGFVNIGVSTPSISSLVLTAGYGNFYARYKMSLKNNPSTYSITTFSPTQYAITDYPLQISDYYEYNGLTSIKRTGITGGVSFNLKNEKQLKKGSPLFKLFIGAGFGEYVPMWGVDIIKYSNASNKISRWGTLINERAKGLELEAGLFIKFKSFNLMGSMNMINDKENGIFTDGSVGVGFIF